MVANFKRSEKVKLVNGNLYRMMYADDILVAKVCEDGSQNSRNLDYCGMFGWRFTKPGTTHKGWNGQWVAELEEWGDYTPKLTLFCWGEPSENDKTVILEKYPGLKWVLQKSSFKTWQIFHLIPYWKKDPKLCETLVSMGFDLLALNGSFYKAKDKWNVVKWLSKNMDSKRRNLQDIRLAMKGHSWAIIDAYRGSVTSRNYVSIDEWLYLKAANLGPIFYRDYKEMCKKAGHNLKDPYWHFPKNLKKAHDKVMKECRAIGNLKKAEELKKKQAEYTAKVSKWLTKTFEDNGLKVFVQGDLAKWQDHADKLHQCIVANRYDDKVIKGECLLVFITKGGKPYATAELKPKGRKFKLGQFYGNERLKDYAAKPDAVEAFNKWAEHYNIKVAA